MKIYSVSMLGHCVNGVDSTNILDELLDEAKVEDKIEEIFSTQ